MNAKIITDSLQTSNNIGSSATSKSKQQRSLVMKYIKSVSIMNKQTANEYYDRLVKFERFLFSHFGSDDNIFNLDNFIEDLKNRKFDVYDVLRNFSLYLLQESNNTIHTTTLKQRIITAKNFLEFYDIDISPRKFKLKVRFPKNIKRDKEAIDKNDIIKILNGCSDIKLKTYVMLLASTGLRAVEALSIRLKDLDLESYPIAKVTIRGEYTKTKIDRFVFLTQEMVEQFNKWLEYKYRIRRVCSKDKQTGELIDEYRMPEKNLDDLVFSVKFHNSKRTIDNANSIIAISPINPTNITDSGIVDVIQNIPNKIIIIPKKYPTILFGNPMSIYLIFTF